MKRGNFRENAERVKEKLRCLPFEALEWAHQRIFCDLVVKTHGLEEEAFHCWENPTIADRGARETADSLAQIEIFVRFVPEMKEFFDHFPGRAAFTPSHLVLAMHGTFLANADTASHLCGNFRCLRPSHIIPEDLQRNVKRKFCPGILMCGCGCETSFCAHNPPCLIKKQN